MTTIGETIVVKGELRASEDITVLGRVEGPMHCEGAALTIGASADLQSDVIARDVTIFGRVAGQVVATEVVDIRAAADVSATIVTPRFILDPDGRFSGRVEPQHLEAALRVSRYNRGRRDADPPV